MYSNNSINSYPLVINSNIGIQEINNTIKEISKRNKDKQLLKQLKNIRRIIKITQRMPHTINAILKYHYSLYHIDWKPQHNNYMRAFLELDFIDRCYLSADYSNPDNNYFNLDTLQPTAKYYYIVDTVLGSVLSDKELGDIEDIFQLHTILETKYNNLKNNLEFENTVYAVSNPTALYRRIKGTVGDRKDIIGYGKPLRGGVL